jgi:CheY-like chemotaxis protein
MKANYSILAIEDDLLEAMTLQRAFRDAGIKNPLHIVSGGNEALTFLLETTSMRPALILLDLNMPGMTGLEFLRVIKSNTILKHIPVIVLTTSSHEHDRDQAFEFSVAGYIVKPMDYEAFVDIVKIIRVYWMINELPT